MRRSWVSVEKATTTESIDVRRTVRIDAYLTDLEDLISRCEYRQMDKPEEELLRDRIVCGVRDDSLRQQFLSKTDLSLANCIDLCRAHEASARQVKDMAGAEKVHVVKKKSKLERITTETSRKPRARATRRDRCGWYHGSSPEDCPAYNALCLNCGKKPLRKKILIT